MHRKVILDVGQAGTGKTRIAKELSERFPRVLILDPLDEYNGTVFYTMGEVLEYFEANPNMERFRVALRNSDENDADYLFALAWSLKNVLVVVEEANIYMDPRKRFPSFLRLISQGRHNMVHLLCVAQRVPEVLISFRAQKTTLVTFWQEEPSDLDHLEDWGFDPEEVKNLTPFDERFQTAVEGTHYLRIGEPLNEIAP